jgi:uncharacterized membrane protein YphA (DoxX/SURF4 family)
MKYNQFREWIHAHADLLVELIRIYLGLGLLVKGVFFFFHPNLLVVPAQNAWLAPYLRLVPYLHTVGGLLLALGVFTRLAALVQLPILFAAVFLVNLPRMSGLGGREGVEFSALVLFLLVLFVIWGSGPLSVLRFLKRTAAGELRSGWDLRARPDLFLDLVRIYLGAGLFLKGIYIMQHEEQFASLLEGWTGTSMLLIIGMHYLVPAHLLGGLMLAFGFLTRLAAMAQLPLLLGAVFYVYLPHYTALEMREDLEFSVLVLFLVALLSAYGAGRFSIDRFLEGEEWSREHKPHLSPQSAH